MSYVGKVVLAAGSVEEVSCPKCGGTKPTCCSCTEPRDRFLEYNRLEQAVVRAAKAEHLAKQAYWGKYPWPELNDGRSAGERLMNEWNEATAMRENAVIALLAFESTTEEVAIGTLDTPVPLTEVNP